MASENDKATLEVTGEPGRFGRFYLQELVNVGGMSEIWLATDERNGACAVRRLRNSSLFNFTEKKRFLNGCDVLSRIHNHDGIIGYLEHGKMDGSLYLAMEYVESSNLKEMYAHHDPVLLENVAQILIDTIEALEHVHESGFMHLDFKPENILVTRNAKVRLIDFDLARPIPEGPTKFKENPGTPAYMAPEQLQRLPIDQRADIFAYGVMSYELLTNQKPFPGETPAEILARQLDRSEFVAPRALNPDMPATLEKIILKCLELEPNRRFPFVSVLANEVRQQLYA